MRGVFGESRVSHYYRGCGFKKKWILTRKEKNNRFDHVMILKKTIVDIKSCARGKALKWMIWEVVR